MANLIMPDLDRMIHIPDLASLGKTGIYFLMLEGVVVYVGQAKNIRKRIAAHIADGVKQFDAIACVYAQPKNLKELEDGYIEKLLPRYNNCSLARGMRAGGETGNGGKLVGETRRIRIPRTNVRRTITVLA